MVINMFLSHMYFTSKNCLREVCATVDQAKPLICTHEADKAKGGGPLDDSAFGIAFVRANLEGGRCSICAVIKCMQSLPWS